MATGRVTAEERVYVALAGLCAISNNPVSAPEVFRIVGIALTLNQVSEALKGLKKKQLIASVGDGFEPVPADCTMSLTPIPGNKIKIETDAGLLQVSHAQLGMLGRLARSFPVPLGG